MHFIHNILITKIFKIVLCFFVFINGKVAYLFVQIFVQGKRIFVGSQLFDFFIFLFQDSTVIHDKKYIDDKGKQEEKKKYVFFHFGLNFSANVIRYESKKIYSLALLFNVYFWIQSKSLFKIHLIICLCFFLVITALNFKTVALLSFKNLPCSTTKII